MASLTEQARAWAFPQTISEGSMWLTWLVRLRWVAIAAQVVTVAFAVQLFASPAITIPALSILILILVIANLWATRALAAGVEVLEPRLLAQLAVDVVVLTGFFLLSDGPDNPFISLYMVHIAMGAVMLGPRNAATLAALVVACYSTTHLVHQPLVYGNHSLDTPVLTSVGQFVAFTITTAAVAVFVVGLSVSLRRRKQQLFEARERTARTDRLRSVGTLAAGAAHELNTPLSTIGLRTRRLSRRHQDADSQRDTQVILEQLKRCTRIVEQLLVGAGDPSAAGLERRPLADLVEEGVKLWRTGSTLSATMADQAGGFEVELPRIAFIQALINLLENARQAQEEVDNFDDLTIVVHREDALGIVEISDRGCGLPEPTDLIGTPFFTTKVHGTGLGVFVAQSVADGAGGGLGYMPRDGGGVTVRWWFPAAERRTS
ncbi:MAG: two-component system sensor histidine kinase RegB [Myxococcota bacterium]|jgi:two-component system sensor histidine kinase RegB